MGACLVLAVAVVHVGGEPGAGGVVAAWRWTFAVGGAAVGGAAAAAAAGAGGEEFVVALLDEVLGGGGVGVVLWVGVAGGFVFYSVVEGALVGGFAFGVLVLGFALVGHGFRTVATGFPDRRHVARRGWWVVVAVGVAHL